MKNDIRDAFEEKNEIIRRQIRQTNDEYVAVLVNWMKELISGITKLNTFETHNVTSQHFGDCSISLFMSTQEFIMSIIPEPSVGSNNMFNREMFDEKYVLERLKEYKVDLCIEWDGNHIFETAKLKYNNLTKKNEKRR